MRKFGSTSYHLSFASFPHLPAMIFFLRGKLRMMFSFCLSIFNNFERIVRFRSFTCRWSINQRRHVVFGAQSEMVEFFVHGQLFNCKPNTFSTQFHFRTPNSHLSKTREPIFFSVQCVVSTSSPPTSKETMAALMEKLRLPSLEANSNSVTANKQWTYTGATRPPTEGWEEIVVKQEQSDDSQSKMKISLPSMPSLYIVSFLFRACEEVHRIRGHVLDKTILQKFALSLLEKVIGIYGDLLPTREASGSQLSEKGVLQVLLELRFVVDVLFGGDSNLSEVWHHLKARSNATAT